MYRYPAIPEQCNITHNELDRSKCAIYNQLVQSECDCLDISYSLPLPCVICGNIESQEKMLPRNLVFPDYEKDIQQSIEIGGSKSFANSLSLSSCSSFQRAKEDELRRKFSVVCDPRTSFTASESKFSEFVICSAGPLVYIAKGLKNPRSLTKNSCWISC